jgi:hypothetical protein
MMDSTPRIYFYSAQKYDQAFFEAANTAHGFNLAFTDAPLNADTARLADAGVRTVALQNVAAVSRDEVCDNELTRRL